MLTPSKQLITRDLNEEILLRGISPSAPLVPSRAGARVIQRYIEPSYADPTDFLTAAGRASRAGASYCPRGLSGEGGDSSSSGGGEGDDRNDPISLGITLDNKYYIKKVLGRGSMGIVYLAHDLGLERDVALKVLLPYYARDEKVAKRFRREAVAMASVRHENVVQIFAFGDHEGYPYFVMEYLPGHTVASLLNSANQRSEHLYIDVVIGILSQVCRGLQAVHDQGIVHRDVKPANMLVGPRFRVAINDFGLVEETLNASAKRDISGTPLYLAPELIKRQAMPEGKLHLSDIYALGISTFEMLTGTMPFYNDSIVEILRYHVERRPPRISDIRAEIPAAFDEVCLRAMSKDPFERPASCMEFFEALKNARHQESFAPRSGTKRILVVDDDPEVRTIYSTALKIGFPNAVIMTAVDGMAALEMVKSARPDLILLDLDLPRMNGLEVAATLTGDEMTNSIPLIVISGHKGEETRTLLRSMGIRDMLHKPIELTHLIDLSQKYLNFGE